MRNTTRPYPSSTCRHRGGSMLALTAALLAAVLVFPGCSTERRYKVLSFFFDGVPDPNKPQISEDDEFAASRDPNAPKLLAVVHKPYAENKCNDCHEGATGRFDDFQKLGSDICLKCHQDVLEQYPVMHGPVSAVECNICHVPHETTLKHLLRDEAPAVCTQCHQPELLSVAPPEHLNPDKSCLDCHSGHGGPRHGLIKPDAQPTSQATSQPAWKPSTQPSPTTTEATTQQAHGRARVTWPRTPEATRAPLGRDNASIISAGLVNRGPRP